MVKIKPKSKMLTSAEVVTSISISWLSLSSPIRNDRKHLAPAAVRSVTSVSGDANSAERAWPVLVRFSRRRNHVSTPNTCRRA